jgi:microcystin-dependent protein
MIEQEANDPTRKKVPGIKRDYLKLPTVLDDFENWICVQLNIPDDDDYIRQFYDLFDTLLGMWFSYQRDDNQGGARVAKIWRQARQTIILEECTGEVIMPACNPTPIGSIIMWATSGDYPTGWLPCFGQSVAVATYPDLFAVIGYQHGGGGANFALPDFQGRSPIGHDPTGGLNYLVGNHYGALNKTLTAANLPPHTHGIERRDSSGFGTAARVATASGAGSNTTQASTDSAGTLISTPFSLLHPTTGIVFLIRASDNDCEGEVIEGPPGPPGATGPAGPPGADGDCSGCETPPGEQDNETPPPPGTPGDAQRCKVAQGVVDSIIDNYYNPLTEFFIEQFIDFTRTPEEVNEALVKMLQGNPGIILWPPAIVALIGFMSSTLLGAYMAAAMAAYVAGNLQALVDALNDPDNREILYCDLYIELPSSGNIDADVWSRFIERVGGRTGLPFEDFTAFITNQIPLYVARTEAFITEGGDFDCAACGESCELEVVWEDVGETIPDGWSIEDDPEALAWSGDTGGLWFDGELRPVDYTLVVRTGANQNFTTTNAPNLPTGICLVYEFDEPCLLREAGFGYQTNTGNSKRGAIGIMTPDNEFQIIHNQLKPAITALSGFFQHLETTVMVKRVYFFFASGRTPSGTYFGQMQSNKVNTL